MRNINRKRLRQHAELVPQIPQILDPLHLVEPVVDESLIEQRENLRASHHHVRLHESLSETLHERDLRRRRQRLPILREIILDDRNRPFAHA